MKIKTVTITGADDSTSVYSLLGISKAYPFVEWGILFSPKRENTARYPSIDWVKKLAKVSINVEKGSLKLSSHLCGDYALETITKGSASLYTDRLREASRIFDRAQLNFNSQKTPVDYEKFLGLMNRIKHGTIIQYNKANYDLCQTLILNNVYAKHVQFLYDGSGGRGVLPNEWSGVVPNHFTGYAGGLTPDNLEEALINIDKSVGDNEIWIDAETGVRTDDKLDLDKVVRFLEIAEKYTK